jgi:Ca2+-binding RTX toxin-like protein
MRSAALAMTNCGATKETMSSMGALATTGCMGGLLFGQAGIDTHGGTGNEMLVGGSGRDYFVSRSGSVRSAATVMASTALISFNVAADLPKRTWRPAARQSG